MHQQLVESTWEVLDFSQQDTVVVIDNQIVDQRG